MTININLLPWREALKERKKKEFITMLGAGICICALLMLCVHLFVSRQIGFQNDLNTTLKNEITQLDAQISQIQDLQKEKAQLLARMEIIQQLQSNRSQVVRLFDGIVHTIPEGLYLTKLMRTGSHIVIDGKAESNTRVSTFMRNIEASPWLKLPVLTLIQTEDAQGEKSKEKQSDRMIEFNLQAEQVINEAENQQAPVTSTDKIKTK